MTKLYERNGRRFVSAIDHTGHYLNSDYTLSEERTENSIAVCVLHTVKEMVFCELNDNPPCLNWDDAKEYCSKKFLGNGKLPEIHELLTVKNCFKNIFPRFGVIWSNTEYYHDYARVLISGYGDVDIKDKDVNYQVLAFLTVDL